MTDYSRLLNNLIKYKASKEVTGTRLAVHNLLNNLRETNFYKRLAYKSLL